MSDYLLDKSLLLLSSAIVSFWVVIWVMHVCALVNAKMKLNKTTTTTTTTTTTAATSHFHPYNCNSKQTHKSTETPTVPIDVVESPALSLAPANNGTSQNHTDNTSSHIGNELYGSPIEEKLLLFDHHNAHLHHNQKESQFHQADEKQLHQQMKQPYQVNDNGKSLNRPFSTNYGQPQQLLASQKSMLNLCNSYVNLPLPGVSVIKPLVGVDDNLYANLESFFCMEYPVYELLFCVQDPDDEAILTVKSLFKLYPEVDAKLFTGGSCVGVNPKINNMQPAYEAAKYELVLVSDSGICMKKDTLLDMVLHMHENVALVHQMPFVCDNKGTGFGSVVEKVYFGTAHARAYLTADLLNINCPTGMSALMRKHLLDEVGGIKAFGQYLAEDFFFAKSFTDRGWKISISSQPAWQNTANTGNNTISTLNGRIQRWIKLRYAMVPHWTFLEPLSECLLLGFLGAISISFLWALDPLAIFTFHIVIWLAFDYALLRTIQNGPLTFSISQFLMGWLVRESTALLVFVRALANRNLVTWRSRVFKLNSGGFAEEIIPDKQNVIFYLYCGDSI